MTILWNPCTKELDKQRRKTHEKEYLIMKEEQHITQLTNFQEKNSLSK